MKLAYPITALFVLLVATSATAEHPLRSAIDAGNQRLEAAVEAGDSAAAGTLYTEDAQLMPTNNEPIAGRQAIEAFWQASMAGLKKIDFETLEVLGEGETVSEIGRYKAWGADGQVLDRGKYIVVWKQEDGLWKLHRDIWNTSLTAAEHDHAH